MDNTTLKPIPFGFISPRYNRRITIVGVPVYPTDTPAAHIHRSELGTNGTYRATYVLAIPGENVFSEDIDMGIMASRGDSCLELPPSISNIVVRTTTAQGVAVVVKVVANAENRLASATITVVAANFVEAERVALNTVMPLLSYWRFAGGVPAVIASRQDCAMLAGGPFLGCAGGPLP